MVNKQEPALRLLTSKTKIFIAIVIASLVSIASTAAVMAAIPDSNGTIHACRNTALAGIIRVIDSASQSCNSQYETALSWASSQPAFVADLSNADFSNADVRYRDFRSKDLSGADFRGVTYIGADFRGANLAGTLLSGVGHSTNFSSVDLSQSIPEDLILATSTFVDANMSGRDWALSDFKGSDFSNVDFNNSSFDSVRFDRHSSGTDTLMANANFTGSIFNDVNFAGTDLTSATLTNTTWTNVVCPDDSLSVNNGDTCLGHLTP